MLDIGTGNMRSVAALPCKVKVGLDAHRPYLENRLIADAVPIHASAGQLGELFVDDAVSLVTIMDVIEHLERDDALSLLAQAERIASRRVIVFTPRGWFPQDDYDAHGLGGEELQQHRSGWEVEDFTGLDYNVVVIDEHHDARNAAFVEAFGADAPPVDALLAWKDT